METGHLRTFFLVFTWFWGVNWTLEDVKIFFFVFTDIFSGNVKTENCAPPLFQISGHAPDLCFVLTLPPKNRIVFCVTFCVNTPKLVSKVYSRFIKDSVPALSIMTFSIPPWHSALNSVENKPASLLVGPFGKALSGIPSSWCSRQTAGNA